jgi:glycine/serine hydroxymethyltransferase
MDEPEMREIASILAAALRSPDDDRVLATCRDRVAALVARFPVYP